MEIIAHRGASRSAPENTLPAFRLAWKQGADVAELDVRLSRDGRLVVSHDATTRRTGGLNRKVCGLTLAELRALVDHALRELLRREECKRILAFEGKVRWEGPLPAMRRTRTFRWS